jgi:class 3 adenylate cyclase
MAETRKLAAILAADVAGYSKLAAADEERTFARLRALRSDLFDPTIALHHGRVVKRTGDGVLIEFRSVVDAVRCAIEVQSIDELAATRTLSAADRFLTNLRGLPSIHRKHHTSNKFCIVGVQKQRGMGDVPSGSHFCA